MCAFLSVEPDGLDSLRVYRSEELSESEKASLEAACSSLPGLAHLELAVGYLPAQLTSMRSLTYLYCERQGNSGVALPASSWLESLKRLGADADLVLDSLPALSAATGLEMLALGRGPELHQVKAVLNWAGSCNCPLKQLIIYKQNEISVGMMQAALDAQHRRPAHSLLKDICLSEASESEIEWQALHMSE
jgi:hypothetical protein